MAEFLLGMKAKAYYGPAEAELSDMTEMDNIRDVTLNMPTGEADITTRANEGWRGIAPTLRECTAEFEMVWKPDDAGFDAIQQAWLASETLELAFLDQDRTTVGARGPKGSFSITNFSRSEPLEEAIIVSVTARLAVFDKWVKVVA